MKALLMLASTGGSKKPFPPESNIRDGRDRNVWRSLWNSSSSRENISVLIWMKAPALSLEQVFSMDIKTSMKYELFLFSKQLKVMMVRHKLIVNVPIPSATDNKQHIKRKQEKMLWLWLQSKNDQRTTQQLVWEASQMVKTSWAF